MTELNEAAPAAAPSVSFASEVGRSEVVTLDYPLVVNGVTLSHVTVRRLTVKDVADYAERLRSLPEDQRARVRLPMFDQPDAVLDALDDDDAERLSEVAQRFLPRRFRASDASE